MRNRNLVMQSAIAMALGVVAVGAQAAGVLTTATRTFATQNFGATSLATAEIIPAPVVYTFNTVGGIVINPAGVANVYFRLSNGAKFTAAPAVGDFSTSSLVTALGLTVSSVALSTDKTTIVATYTNGTGANITIGVGGTAIWVPVAGRAVNTVNTVLNTSAGAVGITASASVLAASVNAASLPSDVDGPIAASVNVAAAASAITASTAAAVGETQKINVAAVPSQTAMLVGVATGSTTIVDFGSFRFTDVAGPVQLNGTTAYNVANNGGATGVSAIATGNFAAATAGGLTLSTTANCATPLAAGSAAVLNIAKTTATWTGGTKLATGVPYFVCMTVDGVTLIPVTQPQITPTLTPTVATEAPVTTAGPGALFSLGVNGATVDVRMFVPAAVTGYSSYMRVVNTGTLDAMVSVAIIDPTTGVAGASGPLGLIKAGGVTTFTAAQIEGVIGVQSVTSRPRLRVTAPSSNLQVQSFMSSPSGVFTDMSGGQLSNVGGTVITDN